MSQVKPGRSRNQSDEDQESDGGTSHDKGAVAARAADVLETLSAEPLDPGLYLVATPIGNLGDITLRALAVLARADVIYCEDTRHSRTLLSHFGIKRPVQPYHDHNADEQRPRILSALARSQRIALISDAGTPLVSDPGYKLARAAIEAGYAVVSIPGASAALAALTSSGLATDAFFFAGFLPPKSGARRTRLRELMSIPATLIFFEAPSRADETLADLAAVFGPRAGVVARELTKLHEEIVRAPLPDLARMIEQREIKGEIVILVGPPAAREVSDGEISDQLERALASMTLRDAAKTVADALGVPKVRVYDLGLAIKRETG